MAGCQKLHSNGSYQHYRGTEGRKLVEVKCYRCPRCGHTWSVIPEGMMPYRSMPVSRCEELLDERLGVASGSARPPPATEIEEGCIRRTVKKLSKRIPFLCDLLGQQMPVLESTDISGFWQAMRELGSTQNILIRLARDFKTSLLGCCRCLRASWERKLIPLATACRSNSTPTRENPSSTTMPASFAPTSASGSCTPNSANAPGSNGPPTSCSWKSTSLLP